MSMRENVSFKILENHPADSRVKIQENNVFQTLSSRMGTGGGNVPMVMESINGEIAGTLDANYYKGCGERQGIEREVVCVERDKETETQNNTVVRRLTPLECTRLQGLPDGWVDIGDWVDSKGKIHKDSDSPKYKALGNSIALPFWAWMAERMVNVLKADGVENPTMASLFDGVSSFCLAYKRCGCEPVWTSEIEDFPIAVCKRHFGDEDTGEVGDIEKFL